LDALKDMLLGLFIPTQEQWTGLKTRWKSVWESVASWGPWGLARALGSQVQATQVNSMGAVNPNDNQQAARPQAVITMPNPFSPYKQTDAPDMPPVLLDLRPRVTAFNTTYVDGGVGSVLGDIVAPLRRLFGVLSYVTFVFLIFRWVRPGIKI
jgi:hypothetical protein